MGSGGIALGKIREKMITVLLSIRKNACLIVCMWLLSVQFLIGYNRGLIVLWDNKESKTEQTYNATQVSSQVGFRVPLLGKVL